MAMNFNEVFKKYKLNTASDEEKKQIEEEIEKYRLISDYVSENDYLSIDAIDEPCEVTTEISTIKKSLKKRTAITISSAVAIMIGIALVINFIAVPLIDKQYYNPTKSSYSENSNDFEIALSAYTELHFPSYMQSSVYAKKTGTGKYNIEIYRNRWITGRTENLSATLDKNKLMMPSGFFSVPAMNAFAYASYPEYYSGKQVFEKNKNYLATLPDYLQIQASVSFDRDLTMQEIVDIQKKYNIIIWAGIRNSEKTTQRYPLIGLNPSGEGPVYEKVNEKYPNFEICLSKGTEELADANILESHFKTMLNFQLDQKEFLKSLADEFNYLEYYTEVSDYINDNGIKSYGVVVLGTPQEILKMCQEDFVCQLNIDDIEISKYPD